MPWCPVLPSCSPLLLTPLPSCANYYPPLPPVPISHQLCSHLIVLTLPLPSVVVQNNPFFPPLLCSLNLLVAFFSFQPYCNWPIISGLIKQNLMTLWEWDVKSKIKKEYLCSLIATRAELQNRYASHCLENLTLWIQQLCLWDLCCVVCCLCAYMTFVVLSCMLPVCVFYCLWGLRRAITAVPAIKDYSRSGKKELSHTHMATRFLPHFCLIP